MRSKNSLKPILSVREHCNVGKALFVLKHQLSKACTTRRKYACKNEHKALANLEKLRNILDDIVIQENPSIPGELIHKCYFGYSFEELLEESLRSLEKNIIKFKEDQDEK